MSFPIAQGQVAAPLTVRVAPMTQWDLAAVSKVELECFDPPMSLPKIRQLWHLDSRFKWRVLRLQSTADSADLDSETVAYSCYADYDSQGHLLKLGCLKAMRGLGLGRWLLLQVLKEMTVSGMSEVQLEVRKSNAVARRLYLRHGFREDGIQPSGYPDGEDAVLMSIPRLQENSVQQALCQRYEYVQSVQRAGSYLPEDRYGWF